MNKKDFIRYISVENNCTKKHATKVIEMFTNAVIGVLGGGDELWLPSFGTFKLSQGAAKIGVNFKTKVPQEIPAYKAVRFKSGRLMKAAVNKK